MYMLYSAHQVQDFPQHLLANNYYRSQTTIYSVINLSLLKWYGYNFYLF